jgi:hypothetical protein
MDLRQAVKRLWRMILPDSVVAAHMRHDWDDRPRRNTRYFVATENASLLDIDGAELSQANFFVFVG